MRLHSLYFIENGTLLSDDMPYGTILAYNYNDDVSTCLLQPGSVCLTQGDIRTKPIPLCGIYVNYLQL